MQCRTLRYRGDKRAEEVAGGAYGYLTPPRLRIAFTLPSLTLEFRCFMSGFD